mmetsp:Transcript_18576/g.27399  ORF Transcript_18576/g.27399 Transcript_18576/m.27399 type:complete len:277 (-) Transcript_18576:325-1155(-)
MTSTLVLRRIRLRHSNNAISSFSTLPFANKNDDNPKTTQMTGIPHISIRHYNTPKSFNKTSLKGGYQLSTISTSHNNTPNKKETRRERTMTKMRASATKMEPTARKSLSLLQQYGPVFVGTYLSVYFLTLGSLFAATTYEVIDVSSVFYYLGKFNLHSVAETAETGVIETVSVETSEEESTQAVKYVVGLLAKYDVTRPYAEMAKTNPHVVNLGVAWVATKLTEPLRFGVTALILPKVAKLLGRGPPPLIEDDVSLEEGKDVEKDGVVENRGSQQK